MTASPLSGDSVYFRNVVYHADGTLCTHKAPAAVFTAFLNHSMDAVLIDDAPKWSVSVDDNIDGKGTFGVEIGGFNNPSAVVGDSVFIQFFCTQKQQQGTVGDSVSGIPWLRFPKTLHLSAAGYFPPPQNLLLSVDTAKGRTLTWAAQSGMHYSVYRRTMQDTAGDYPRKLYRRIAENLDQNSFTDTSMVKDHFYGYIIYAIAGNGAMSAHSAEVHDVVPDGLGGDLSVGWIARLPRIDYEWASTDPAVDGWPRAGQTVTWQAHIRNWFSKDLPAVKYQWWLDGVIVDSGSVAIAAQQETLLNFPWTWTFDRHTLRCVIDPDNRVTEEEEQNNDLTIYTNAIGAGFYVEQSTYNYFHRYQRELKVHSNSWEDWAQRHVRRWNQMFANAVYPETPNGVLDRIRIDNITIVPDNALPLAGGLATNDPNLNDRTVDLQWGFTAAGVQGSFYANHTAAADNNAFYFEGSLLHELGHARYLIDVYGFNVQDNGSGNTIGVKENGSLIVGTALLPKDSYTKMTGLMNGQYTYVDRYSAAAMNLIAGHRAVKGNYNAPGNIGIFMNDLPVRNRLTIKDESGNLLNNASVRIYRAIGQAGAWYGKYFDNAPDMELSSDSVGSVELGRCPFDSAGTIHHDYGYSNAVILLRVASGEKVGYAFFESFWMNLQYWNGQTALGQYELTVPMRNLNGVERTAASVPIASGLLQNYPNPFNGSTEFRIRISQAEDVWLEIFDILGRHVTTLLQEHVQAGEFAVRWDAGQAESGVYFCRFTAGSRVETRRAVVLK